MSTGNNRRKQRFSSRAHRRHKEKWEDEFEKLSDGLCEKKNKDGSMVFSAENAHKYFERISEFPDLESWNARRKERNHSN